MDASVLRRCSAPRAAAAVFGREGLPRIRVSLGAMLASIVAMGCAGQAAPLVPRPVLTQLAQALQPGAKERVRATADSSPLFPGVRFFVAHRWPPTGSGGAEDPRPRRVGLVQSGDRQGIVVRAVDLPAAWTIAWGKASPPDSTVATALAIELVVRTGFLSDAEVLRSERQARRQIPTWQLTDTTALSRVHAPKRVPSADGIRIEFFTDETTGLRRWTVVFLPSGVMTLTSHVESDYLLAM